MTDTNPRNEQGFVTLAVLLLVTLMGALGVTLAGHLIVDHQSSRVAPHAVAAREAVQSGVTFAQQALAAGKVTDGGTKAVAIGPASAQVTIADVADGHHGILSRSLDSAKIGSTVLVETSHVAAALGGHPDLLPKIDHDRLVECMNDPSIQKHWYSGMSWVTDTELEGIVIVENTSALFLDDVVVKGVIISEDVISGDPIADYTAYDTPCLLVDGHTKIVPGDFLPGVSIVMPDGIFTTWSDAETVQLDGDVVAHEMTMGVPTFVNGNIATVAPCPDQHLEQPGQGRGPVPWAEDLDLGASFDLAYLAYLPHVPQVSGLSNITGYFEAAGLEEDLPDDLEDAP